MAHRLLEINKLSLEKAALAYASLGWPVLPLNAGKKEPNGKLVKNGLNDASTDLGTVRTWWEMYPGSNIAIRTGVVFDVVDLDGKPALDSLRMVASSYKHLGPVAATGKGYHLIFGVTGARNSAARYPGIDFRGQQGYIAVAPSVHPNGHKYQWVKDGEIPAPPEWLDKIVKPARTAPPERSFEVDDIVDRFIALFKGHRTLQSSGELYYTNCIWHDDSTPSLYLYPNDTFYCFGCEEWGDTLDLQWSFDRALEKPSTLRAERKAQP